MFVESPESDDELQTSMEVKEGSNVTLVCRVETKDLFAFQRKLSLHLNGAAIQPNESQAEKHCEITYLLKYEIKNASTQSMGTYTCQCKVDNGSKDGKENIYKKNFILSLKRPGNSFHWFILIIYDADHNRSQICLNFSYG